MNEQIYFGLFKKTFASVAACIALSIKCFLAAYFFSKFKTSLLPSEDYRTAAVMVLSILGALLVVWAILMLFRRLWVVPRFSPPIQNPNPYP
ncbi:MAG TPA: hypothetical protein VJH70_01485 [Candidatus Paceibacterota bacterium]